MCVLSLDFQEAFDRICQQDLFTILQSYGLSDWFVDRIRNVYKTPYPQFKSTDTSQDQLQSDASFVKDALCHMLCA
jgi:hypothetical protein